MESNVKYIKPKTAILLLLLPILLLILSVISICCFMSETETFTKYLICGSIVLVFLLYSFVVYLCYKFALHIIDLKQSSDNNKEKMAHDKKMALLNYYYRMETLKNEKK